MNKVIVTIPSSISAKIGLAYKHELSININTQIGKNVTLFYRKASKIYKYKYLKVDPLEIILPGSNTVFHYNFDQYMLIWANLKEFNTNK